MMYLRNTPAKNLYSGFKRVKKVFIPKTNSILAVLSFIIISLPGCSALINLNERAMTPDDIIAMSKAGVSSNVINTQIDATHSRFELTPQQIISLKKAGVKEKVIKKMVETSVVPDYYDWEYSYAPYDYYDWYPGYNNYYHYNPYWHYRTPGLIGKFYNYYPPYPYRPYGDYRWDENRKDKDDNRDQQDNEDK